MIKEVQEEFNSTYPFLKIEFSVRTMVTGNPHPATVVFPPNRKLAEASKKSFRKREIGLSDLMTVYELEKNPA